MENNETTSDSFKRELDAVSTNTILDPAFRKKKLILWAIRTSISVVLYIVFWKYDWIKWTLVVTVPLSIFSLFTIIGSPYILKRKIERTNRKIEQTENLIGETQEE
jgi:ABC-type transport system involved in Fe-S cluster assembly fused permease/ATPase subunit